MSNFQLVESSRVGIFGLAMERVNLRFQGKGNESHFSVLWSFDFAKPIIALFSLPLSASSDE